MNLQKIAGGIVVAGSAAGAIALWWPRLGWQTPNAHDMDIQQSVTLRLDGLFLAVQQNHDAWRCDELQEELSAILDRQDSGEGTAQDSSRRSWLENRMQSGIDNGGLACGRFED